MLDRVFVVSVGNVGSRLFFKGVATSCGALLLAKNVTGTFPAYFFFSMYKNDVTRG